MHSNSLSIFQLFAVLLGVTLSETQALPAGIWRKGRATFYGLDGYSIHRGSCELGYQWPDIYPGFDTTAMADSSSEYAGSCGRCYEVKCRNVDFTDGYGEKLGRTTACFNTSTSIVVKSVDTCPCKYPDNEYSNKRWCCGDAGAGDAHFDLSVWAFEKLAQKNLGVIAIMYRTVRCDHRPARPAPMPKKPSPPELPPPGAVRPSQQGHSQWTPVSREVGVTHVTGKTERDV